MLRRICLTAAIAAMLATILSCAPSFAQAPDRIEKAARDSIRSLGLQTEFPRKVEPIKIPVPAEAVWVALACAAALLAYSLRDALPIWLGWAKPEWDTPTGGAQAAAGGDIDALSAADRLSGEGRFVEAMHMLLLQGLADIRRALGERFADSLTSREILRGARLPAPARTSLRDIIAAVERTYFGGYPAEQSDYAACRRNFEALRSTLHGGAPA
jgi:uncharacterized protein DUF4129